MNKPRMIYFEEQDVLYLALTSEPEVRSLELSPNITAELNAKDELIGVEILEASLFMRDAVLESVQARMTQMLAADPA